MVGLDAHRAVRHVARVVELVAGHLEHARRRERAESELHRGVSRIHRDDAVGVELVVVDVGRERADRHRPDAVLAFRHRVGLAVELADERDFLRVRRAEAQRHRLVGMDLGRDDRRAAASAASTLRRWRCPRLSCRRCLPRGRLRADRANREHRGHQPIASTSCVKHLIPSVLSVLSVACDLIRWLLKQHRRELVQVVAPVDPRVAAGVSLMTGLKPCFLKSSTVALVVVRGSRLCRWRTRTPSAPS